ncbi:MAG: hypothetical protein P8X51_07580 [Maritimibacter sp.]
MLFVIYIVAEHTVTRVPDYLPDLSGPPIAYDYLANEETDPFPIDQIRLRPDIWREPIIQYSNVRDCLVAEERNADMPNLRRIDWAGLSSVERSVCVWRIFASLGTPERAADWARAQRLKVLGTSTHDQAQRDGYISMRALHYAHEDNALLPGGTALGRRVSFFLTRDEGVMARWSVDGKITSAKYYAYSK